MQVKDYLQALTDENKIHVEKIGSGNWYWSFLSEEKHERDTTLAILRKEKDKIEGVVQDLEEKMRDAKDKRGDDDDGRSDLVQRTAVLEADVVELRKELGTYKDCDLGELERKKKEVDGFKVGAERWTDNISILEAYVKDKMLGGDAAGLEQVRHMVFGSEYVVGEGLKELELD